VRATLVVARGSSVFLLDGDGRPSEFRATGSEPNGPPPALLAALRAAAPGTPVVAGGPGLRDGLARALGREVRLAGPAAWRLALAALPPAEPAAEREGFLRRARAALDAALRSPEEVLVSLAREEERLSRAVGRESRAAEAFVAVAGTPLEGYAREWRRSREQLEQHHAELVHRLEAEARRTLPNLSAVLGPTVAARLAAAAGGPAALARISASRLQLLGSRRRPSPERGPRFGVLYLTEGADDVPEERRAAYARSVAALAAIAARADVLTHRDLSAALLRRREARRSQLRRRRR